LCANPSALNSDLVLAILLSVTNGTHTVVESTFGQPCVPIHDTNITINGFNSGLRDAANGSAKTLLTVEIEEAHRNRTIWFYDIWGCGRGGVGAINANDSDWENLGAFVRNAKRLNGTGEDTSSFGGFTGRPTSSRPAPTGTATSSSAEKVGANAVKAIYVFTPLLLAMFSM